MSSWEAGLTLKPSELARQRAIVRQTTESVGHEQTPPSPAAAAGAPSPQLGRSSYPACTNSSVAAFLKRLDETSSASASSASASEQQQVSQQQQEPQCRLAPKDLFLVVLVEEAVNLPTGSGTRLTTCDPFVAGWMTWRDPAVRSPGSAAVPSATPEQTTRTLDVNSFPMWHQSFAFPLDRVGEAAELVMEVRDRDGWRTSVCGKMSMSVGNVLEGLAQLGQTVTITQNLYKGNANQARGQLTVSVSVHEKQSYNQAATLSSELQRASTVHGALSGHELHLKLHSVTGLTELIGAEAELAVELSLCEEKIRLPLKCALHGGEAHPRGVEAVIPLRRALAAPLRSFASEQKFGDVHLRLVRGKDGGGKEVELAKTQVPIWDVPFRHETPQQPPIASANAAASAAEGGVRMDLIAASAAFALLLAATWTLVGPWAAVAVATATLLAALGIMRATPTAPSASGSSGTGAAVVKLAAAAGGVAAAAVATAAAAATAATARPLWDGKRYRRDMERFSGSKVLSHIPVAELSLQLVRAHDPATSAVKVMDFNTPDVASPAEPLPEPAALAEATLVCNFVICCGPHALFRELFTSESKVSGKVAALLGIMDVRVVQPWGADPEGRALAATRTTYKTPGKCGLPPSSVIQEQKVLAKTDGGFAVQSTILPGITGEAVGILVQVVGKHAGPGKTHLTAEISTGCRKVTLASSAFFRLIQKFAPAETRSYYEKLKEELRALHGVEEAPPPK